MRFLIPLLLLASWLTAPLAAQAESNQARTDHAKLRLLVDAEAGWAAVEITHDEDWHSYWVNPGDSGLPTEITWQASVPFEAGEIAWQPPKRIDYEGLFNYGYEGTTALLAPVQFEPADDASISAHVTFLICKDICIPQEAMLSWSPEHATDDAAQIARWRSRLPADFTGVAKYDITPHGVFMAVDLTATAIELQRIYHAWWYPQDAQTISNAAEPEWRLDGSILILQMTREGAASPDPFRGLLEVATTDGQRFFLNVAAQHEPAATANAPIQLAEFAQTPSQAESSAQTTLWMALALAFLGGIILNLMPCVLPVLALKALSLTKHSGASAATLRLEGLAYTAGIVVSFLAVAGALILLQQAGESIGWGFQLQSTAFVSALIFLLFAVGLNLLGSFEMPSGISNLGSGLASKDGKAGAFFTGVLATIVATPCTAPFMATALGFALSQPPHVALLIFSALGLGLAFPYLLITFIPAATRLLPRPGAWMERFKQLLAFPIFATVIWLLWVLAQQSGAMGVLAATSGVLLIGFAVWLLPLLKETASKGILVLAMLAALLLLARTEGEALQPTLSDEIAAEAFDKSALEEHISQGRAVLVNATAAWCITCKVNERVALRADSVQAELAAQNIIYMVADWTNRDAAITEYLASFERSGVPLYVYYAPNQAPVILPQLLTPALVLEALQKRPI
jgi:thiol:disulfide interchange protein/DsbC/DsbD-like thiol-disulfide interchange protein